MVWLRSHWFVISLLICASLTGAVLGSRAAASELIGLEPVPVPITVDQLHPIEVVRLPPFLKSIEAATRELGLSIYPEDRVTSVPGIEFGLGGQLIIERAVPITITDAGESTTYRTWVTTVGDLVAEQRIELGESDRVEPGLNRLLARDLRIAITRVTVAEVTKTEAIAFPTKTVDNPDVPRGERQTIQRGDKGSKTLTYQVTRENGKETGRKLVKTEVTKEPVEEIISLGTRVKTLGSGRATWYDPPWSGLTAAHNTLPKGTLVDVVNVKNGRRVTVKINDHGIHSDAVIDLSVEAFRELGSLRSGVLDVRLEIPG